jgi:hypothetical protein
MCRAKIEIRCPSQRKHKVKSSGTETEYSNCGSLLGAAYEGDLSDFRCGICKKWWEVSFDKIGTMVMTGVKKGTHIDLEKRIRSVNDDANG